MCERGAGRPLLPARGNSTAVVVDGEEFNDAVIKTSLCAMVNTQNNDFCGWPQTINDDEDDDDG